MPPFTRGKKQLSQPEVDTARQLSRVRIHVERVIGNDVNLSMILLPPKMAHTLDHTPRDVICITSIHV